jgi:hypothetical protein
MAIEHDGMCGDCLTIVPDCWEAFVASVRVWRLARCRRLPLLGLRLWLSPRLRIMHWICGYVSQRVLQVDGAVVR